MPRVNTQKANKDYPDQGIMKGDTYYSWSFRYGGSFKSKTPPRPSQLTQSKLSGAYAAQEALEDAVGEATCIDDITSAIETCVGEINDVAQEYRDAKDNMPEGLQEGPTGQECEEKADALEAYASELESAQGDIESMDASEFVDEEERKRLIAEEQELTDQALIDVEFAKLEIKDFDDLAGEEQEQMLDAARDFVNGVSLDI